MPNSFDQEEILLSERYDFLLKLIIIGESSTGKTSLLNYFLSGTHKNPSHTIGVSFASTILKLPSTIKSNSRSNARNQNDTKTLKLQCWDTAGQERFRAVTRNYYRSAIGAVICYDITRRSTFTTLDNWIRDARQLAAPDLVCVLVGTKLDEDDNRQVPSDEGARYAKENGLLFVEVSNLTGENVSQPFYLIAKAVLQAIESGQIDPSSATSGVSFGERSLQRVTSWSNLSSRSRFSKCC